MSELITVIIPVYNTEKYLTRCVESVQNQTYQNLEIILVDDGSPDNSGVLCDQLASKDPRIRVIHKRNGGLSDARNAGIDSATGQYICFCDSDDWMEDKILETARREIQRSGADLLIWSYAYDKVDKNESLISTNRCTMSGTISRHCTDILVENSTQTLIGFAWNKLYKTSIVKDGGFRFSKGISLVEDVLYNSSVICHCNKIRIINTIGTHYMQRNGSSLGNAYYKNFSELICLAAEAKKKLMNHFGYPSEAIERIISDYFMRSLKVGIVSIIRNNQINDIEKKQRMRAFLSDGNTRVLLKKAEARYLKEKIFVFLMRIKALPWLTKLL